MPFAFEKLVVYQKAVTFADEIAALTEGFPRGCDALGRRIKKVVTNSEPFDGATYFYYNRKWQLVESRDAERD